MVTQKGQRSQQQPAGKLNHRTVVRTTVIPMSLSIYSSTQTSAGGVSSLVLMFPILDVTVSCPSTCLSLSMSAGVLAALRLSVSVRDVQRSSESSGDLCPLCLARFEQHCSKPLDHLHDTDVSRTGSQSRLHVAHTHTYTHT